MSNSITSKMVSGKDLKKIRPEADISFVVEDEYGISIDSIEIVKETEFGVYVVGTHEVGSKGFPKEDSYDYSKRLYVALNHPTAITGSTEGEPVWFENSAWCNNCKKIYSCQEKYIGEIKCEYCGSTFPRNGIMRFTAPSRVKFKKFVNKVENLTGEKI